MDHLLTFVLSFKPITPTAYSRMSRLAYMLHAAKAMALTAYDLLTQPEFLAAVKAEWSGFQAKAP